MSRFIRMLIVPLFFSIPPIFVGALFNGLKGSCVGWVVTWVGLCFVAAYSERGVTQALDAKLEVPEGLKRSLELVAGSNVALPRLSIFPEATASLFTVRALGGRGTLLLSQGLLALLNEEELRTILKVGLFRLQDSSQVFQSFSAQMSLWLLRLMPRGWEKLIFRDRALFEAEEQSLGPLSALLFLIFFPVVTFFINLAKPSILKEKNINFGEAYSIAMQKIERTALIQRPRIF